MVVHRIPRGSSLAVALIVLVSCSTSATVDSTSSVPDPTTSPTTTASMSTTTSTSRPPTTTATSTTTTLPQLHLPDDPADPAVVGLEFTTAVAWGITDDEFGRLDGWQEVPEGALFQVGGQPVRVVVDGRVVDLWIWHWGGFGPQRPTIELIVVGAERNPFVLSEYLFEIDLEGAEPPEPDPTVLHDLAVWAVREDGSSGRFTVTDAMSFTRNGQNMGYEALIEVEYEGSLCSVAPSITDHVYAYVDRMNPVKNVFYPATVLFSVSEEGTIETPDPGLVSCVLLTDIKG